MPAKVSYNREILKWARTSARVSLEKVGEGYSITAVHLVLKASVPGADDATFQACAAKAKANCPVSKLFNTNITLDASLVP